MKKILIILNILVSFNLFSSAGSYYVFDKINIEDKNNIQETIKDYIKNIEYNTYQITYKKETYYLYKVYSWKNTILFEFLNNKNSLYITNDQNYIENNSDCQLIHFSPIDNVYGSYKLFYPYNEKFNFEAINIKPFKKKEDLILNYDEDDIKFLPYYGNSYNIQLTDIYNKKTPYKFVLKDEYIEVMKTDQFYFVRNYRKNNPCKYNSRI